MTTTTFPLKISKQDWENFSLHCETAGIDKSQMLTIIIYTWLDQNDINTDDTGEEDIILFSCNYNKEKLSNLKFKRDYSSGMVVKTVRIEVEVWRMYTNFCKQNNFIRSGLLNALINSFIYKDFTSIHEDKDNNTNDKNNQSSY